MKTIVTGGSGFIGSHLVRRLLCDGHAVIALDNFSTGNIENLADIREHPNLTVIPADVTEQGRIGPYFEGVNWVFHLAALADIVPSIERPHDYYHANVTGTFSVLEASRAAGVSRFVYAASSSCYGIPEAFPTPEAAPIRPQYPYALTKWLGEQMALHWGIVYKLPVVSLRFFNVYGPGSRTNGSYGAVLGVFLAQKLAGKPFTVVGDGNQTRDFTFVTDVADACVMAAASSLRGEVMNVGSGQTHSINRLVELLGGDKINIQKRPGEPDCTFADTSKIRALLGWGPKITFEEGVRIVLKNIEYWRTAVVWTPERITEVTRQWFKQLS